MTAEVHQAGGMRESWADDPAGRSCGGVLVHSYEELAQHRGRMEVTRDVLRAPWVQVAQGA